MWPPPEVAVEVQPALANGHAALVGRQLAQRSQRVLVAALRLGGATAWVFAGIGCHACMQYGRTRQVRCGRHRAHGLRRQQAPLPTQHLPQGPRPTLALWQCTPAVKYRLWRCPAGESHNAAAARLVRTQVPVTMMAATPACDARSSTASRSCAKASREGCVCGCVGGWVGWVVVVVCACVGVWVEVGLSG